MRLLQPFTRKLFTGRRTTVLTLLLLNDELLLALALEFELLLPLELELLLLLEFELLLLLELELLLLELLALAPDTLDIELDSEAEDSRTGVGGTLTELTSGFEVDAP